MRSKIFTVFLMVLSQSYWGCQKSSFSENDSGEPAPAVAEDEEALITGQLSLDGDLSADVADENTTLSQRDIIAVNASGLVVGRAETAADGTYAVTVPGALTVDVNPDDEEELENIEAPEMSSLALTNAAIKLQTVISDTKDGTVIGLNRSIDFTNGALVKLGTTPLKKITAIRGRVLLDGARDHTGVVVYIPGTSFAARTDSAGQFLMTFIEAGTYELRFEKDGYVARDVSEITVSENETTQLDTYTLKLSGGTTAFSVKQVGDEGVSKSRTVEFLITPGSADRFKGGLINDVEAMEYAAVPEAFRYDAPADGVYTFKFIFANADGFESAAVRTVEVDTVAPDPTGLSLADRDSLSTSHTNESIVIAYHSSCNDIDKLAIVASGSSPSDTDYIWSCHISASDSNANFQLPSGSSYNYEIWAKDKVGNISQTSVSGTIIFDDTPPGMPSFTLTDQTSGSSLGTDITTINLTMTDCTDIDKVLISESQFLQPAASAFSQDCDTTANHYTYTFSNNIAGNKTILVWALDPAGNVGTVSGTQSMTLDQTAPNSPTFTLADPTEATAEYSNTTTVSATLANCTDTTHVMLSESQVTQPGENDAGWVTCTTGGINVTLSGEGLKTVYLWARDIGGNISATSTSDTITVDTTPPGTGGITVQASDPSSTDTSNTNEQTVDMSVSPCSDDVRFVYFTESVTTPTEGDFSISCPGASLSSSYTFTNTTNELKTIYVWVRDIAGNIAATSLQTQITYDDQNPALPSTFDILDQDTGSDSFTNSADVDYAVDACPAGDFFLIRQDQATAPAEGDSDWTTCATSGSLTGIVSAGAGLKTIHLWKKDPAGNIDGPVATTTTWDSDAPSAPNVTSPASTLYTQNANITVSGTCEANATVVVTGAKDPSYEITADGAGNWSGNIELNDNSFHSVTFTTKDQAGNLSSGTFRTIYHDTIAPSITNVDVLLTDTTATITWNTNESVTRFLEWGPTASYGTTDTNASYSSVNSSNITGLTANTTYHFHITATDQAGNTSAGNDHTATFKTYIAKSGNITSNETWSATDTSYFINNHLTIDSGVTLTIDPGVTVRFVSGKSMVVDGELVARGTSGNEITFTSNTVNPQNSYWNAIQFSTTSTAVTFSGDNYDDGNILEYVNIDSGASTDSLISMDSTGVAIFNCNITHHAGASWIEAIELQSSSELHMRDSSITATGSYYYLINASASASEIDIRDNTLTINSASRAGMIKATSTITDVNIEGNTFTGYRGSNSSNEMRAINLDATTNSTITGNTFIPGNSFAIAIDLEDSATISYNLIRDHTSSGEPALWLNPDNNTETFNITNNVFLSNRVAIGVLNSNYTALTYNITDNIFIDNTSLNDANTAPSDDGPATIVNLASSVDGEATFNINNNLIYENYGAGSNQTLFNLWQKDAGDNMVYAFANNNLIGNTTTYYMYTLVDSGEPDIVAQSNYWGTTNTTEIDNKIFDNNDDNFKATVDYSSYLTAPSATAPISPVENLAIVDNGGGSISLSWDANPESDTAGYIIYYDTDSGWPYEGTGATQGASGIDAGNVTSFNVTGLSTSSTYKFSVTAYDGGKDNVTDQYDGNESWFCDDSTVSPTP